MPTKINLNQKVMVCLTDKGRQHLIDRHQRIYGEHASKHPFRGAEEDDDGFSTWQLWHLMGVFGELLQHPTYDPPMETEIFVVED